VLRDAEPVPLHQRAPEWGWQAQQLNAPINTAAEDPTESLVELHEQLEVADWSPSPTPSYFISTGYTR